MTLVMLAMVPFIAVGTSTGAKETPIHGSRHTWSALYLERHHQHSAVDDWYAPARSPGWQEEQGN
jgi:hypothetical protein